MTSLLEPGNVTLAQWAAIYAGAPVALPETALAAVERAARTVDEIVARGEPVYGINTGFGKLASVRIAREDLAILQRNIVLSHAAGVGMLRGREWAHRLLYAIVGWYALTGLAVASMAITMRLRDDPVSTVANMSAMVTFGCVFAVLASVLYAPLLGLRLPRAHRPGAHLPHAGGA